MSWSLPEARKLAFHQMGTTGKCEGHWRGAWSLPSGHFSCPQCSLRPWRAREKGLSLKPAPRSWPCPVAVSLWGLCSPGCPEQTGVQLICLANQGIPGFRWKWNFGIGRVNIYRFNCLCVPIRAQDMKCLLIMVQHTFLSHVAGESLHYREPSISASTELGALGFSSPKAIYVMLQPYLRICEVTRVPPARWVKALVSQVRSSALPSGPMSLPPAALMLSPALHLLTRTGAPAGGSSLLAGHVVRGCNVC